MIEDIKTAMEKDDAKNAVSRPGLLDKISKLRDAVETPQDSILRIYSQPMQNAALRVAVELGLLETISGVEPGTDVSLDHLAEMGRSDPHLLCEAPSLWL